MHGLSRNAAAARGNIDAVPNLDLLTRRRAHRSELTHDFVRFKVDDDVTSSYNSILTQLTESGIEHDRVTGKLRSEVQYSRPPGHRTHELEVIGVEADAHHLTVKRHQLNPRSVSVHARNDVIRPSADQTGKHALGMGKGRLLIKRDDLIGLGGGGNKVRKLEVTMADAVASGLGAVVTTGVAQSNHARLTAAAGARLGLRVELVLSGVRPDQVRGNLLLDDLFGAEVIFVGDEDAELVADELTVERSAFRIPFGGSSARSAEAYRDAGTELWRRCPT